MKVGEKDVKLNDPILSQKPVQLLRKLRKHDLVTTEGWFQR